MPLRLLIVDDHPLARQLIRTAIQFCSIGQPEIVGEAMDGSTALELARRLNPDVITMDIGLPDMSGFEATRRLKVEMPRIVVIVVSAHDARRYRDVALSAGAVAYVSKDNVIEELTCCLDRLESQRPA